MKNKQLFYVGGYKNQSTHCLYSCIYNTSDGTLEIQTSYEIDNASYLCFSPNGRYLYSVLEEKNYKGRSGGAVAAFAVEGEGRLSYINEGFTDGSSPCHLSVSADGKILYVANYSSGSTTVFDLLPTGGIGLQRHLLDHNNFGSPSRAVPGRQDGPHAHYVMEMYADGKYSLWLCDLGLDAILKLDESNEVMEHYQTSAGFGPRHLAFHPSLPKVYAVGELSCTVTEIGSVDEFSVLKEGDKSSTCAGIRITPKAKYLLVSNRENEKKAGSISILSLNDAGNITGLKKVIPSGGICPRDFDFNPAGDKLFVANQESDSVNVFDWSEETGELVSDGVALTVQRPTCILFGKTHVNVI